MSGKRITKRQIKLYMDSKKDKHSQKTAAAKAGFSERSAHNLEKRGLKEAKAGSRNWRTRSDPFEEVWDTEVRPLLEREPNLQAITLLEQLQLNHPEQFPDKLLRTLQRRVRHWKAMKGPEKEIIFRQEQPPGWQGISDFTWATKLNVTIKGEALHHLLYHFRLPYSGWDYAQVVLGGESFSAVSEGLQNALWLAGGVPKTHRTDSLSAAYKNLTLKEGEDFTQLYQELHEHYGMEATRNNKGVSHENGAIESPNRHLKSRLNQALMLRNSRDFDTIEDYRGFVAKVQQRYNARNKKALQEELQFLKPLPEHRACDFTEERVKVTRLSTIRVKEVAYSVPSRLIGMTMKIHLYDDRLECFVGGDHVVNLPRLRYNKKRIRQINYRHIIGSLVRKPQAFRNYVYKDSMFPTFAFRQAWEALDKALDERKACREYVVILYEASKDECESVVNSYLEECLINNRVPKSEEVKTLFASYPTEAPNLKPIEADLDCYDNLLTVNLRETF